MAKELEDRSFGLPGKEEILDYLSTSDGRQYLRADLHNRKPKERRYIQSVLKNDVPQIKDGDWLDISKPSPETLQTLLFLLPPNHQELSQSEYRYMYNRRNHDVVPPFNPGDDFIPKAWSQVFLENAWMKIQEFRHSTANPAHLNPASSKLKHAEKLEGKALSPETLELRDRFGFNFQQAINVLHNGYRNHAINKGDERRTGENVWAHSIRTMFRLVSEPIPRIDEKYWSVAYTSYLAMLLHDCIEDEEYFENFTIRKSGSPTNGVDKFLIEFDKSDPDPQNDAETKNIRHFSFPIRLTDKEYEILRLQLDGLTSPEEAVLIHETDPEKSAEIQFRHLNEAVEKLKENFPGKVGIIAAIYLLRAKTEDRLDNLYTYLNLSSDKKTDSQKFRTKLKNKIWETINNFEQIEGLSEQLIIQLLKELNIPQTIDIKPYLWRLKSSVDFCYSLLLGANSDEIFRSPIEMIKIDRQKHSGIFSEEEFYKFQNRFRLYIAHPYDNYSSCELV